MPHIAFFNRSFYPDAAATGQLLTELCEDLVQKHGCRVSVVAGAAADSGSGDGVTMVKKGHLFGRELHRGIQILRARGTHFEKGRIAGRFSNYMSYFLTALYAGLRLKRPDVVVALTDPPIIGLAAYLVARRFRVPFVMNYRDIFPEVGKLLEGFQSNIVNRILSEVNSFLVHKADRVVALGETMQRRLIEEKGAHPTKTIVIPDWADCSEIVPRSKKNHFSAAQGLADRFVVMHSGNMGLSQGLEAVVRSAVKLQEVPDIQLVFVGNGVKKSSLQQQVQSLGLSNVRFLPYQPKENLKDSFASADVFVVSLKRGLAGYIVPSKLYGILAAGRPYVAAVEETSEVAAITQKYHCGLLAEPEDSEDIAEKILSLYRDPALAHRLGANARQAAFQFDRPLQVRAYHDLFSTLVSSSPCPNPIPPS